MKKNKFLNADGNIPIEGPGFKDADGDSPVHSYDYADGNNPLGTHPAFVGGLQGDSVNDPLTLVENTSQVAQTQQLLQNSNNTTVINKAISKVTGGKTAKAPCSCGAPSGINIMLISGIALITGVLLGWVIAPSKIMKAI